MKLEISQSEINETTCVVQCSLVVAIFLLIMPFSVLAMDDCVGQVLELPGLNMDMAYEVFEGCVVKKDLSSAARLCRKIKDLNCRQLALRYGQSLIKSKDEKQGAQWIFYSAANADPVAQKQLGIMFSLGAGVSVSYIKAYTFLSLARSNAAEGTENILNMLEEKLTPDLKKRAQLYKKALQSRGVPDMSEIGQFTDVLILTDSQKDILRKKVALCNLVADGVKVISSERDKKAHSKESIKAAHSLVMGKLKNSQENISRYVEALLGKISVLVYLGKNIKPESFRLYYFTQCVSSVVKNEKPIIELNSIHEVIDGLEKCQENPGVDKATDFSFCIKQHVLPYVAKRI